MNSKNPHNISWYSAKISDSKCTYENIESADLVCMHTFKININELNEYSIKLPKLVKVETDSCDIQNSLKSFVSFKVFGWTWLDIHGNNDDDGQY